MKYILIITALSLNACGGSYWERVEADKQAEVTRLGDEAKLREQKPNDYAYIDGEKHGCSSGHYTGGTYTYKFQKDVNQYINNAYYKTGWDDGFAKCKGLSDSVGRSFDNALTFPN